MVEKRQEMRLLVFTSIRRWRLGLPLQTGCETDPNRGVLRSSVEHCRGVWISDKAEKSMKKCRQLAIVKRPECPLLYNEKAQHLDSRMRGSSGFILVIRIHRLVLALLFDSELVVVFLDIVSRVTLHRGDKSSYYSLICILLGEICC